MWVVRVTWLMVWMGVTGRAVLWLCGSSAHLAIVWAVNGHMSNGAPPSNLTIQERTVVIHTISPTVKIQSLTEHMSAGGRLPPATSTTKRTPPTKLSSKWQANNNQWGKTSKKELENSHNLTLSQKYSPCSIIHMTERERERDISYLSRVNGRT